MDLRDLRCVDAIAETGSFVRAAEKLNMSQPSVSARMRNLEATMGFALFKRTPRGVDLTPEGAELHRHARRIIGQVRRAEEELADFRRSPVGLVRVGLPTSLTASLAVPLLERCLADLPYVKLRIVESMSGYLLQWLREGTIDIAVTFGSSGPPDMVIAPLAREELLFVARNAETLARYTTENGTVPLHKLADVPLVLPGPEHGLRILVADQARQQAVALNVVVEIEALGEIQRLVDRGVGCTIMSSAAYDNAYISNLTAAVIRRPSISRVVNIATSAEQVPTRAARQVLSRLRDCIYALVAEKRHFSEIEP